MNPPARLRALGPWVVACCATACATDSGLSFAPAVQDTELRGEADDLQGRLSVAWFGIARHEDVPELRFRVRLENPGPTTFVLLPTRFELVDARLAPFAEARVQDLPVAVAPGDSAEFELAFPAAAGGFHGLDLSSLSLSLEFQAGRWVWKTTFQRVGSGSDPESWDDLPESGHDDGGRELETKDDHVRSRG